MNHVERFRAVMDFQPVDRLPRWEWAMWWNETIANWKRQGLPARLESVFEMNRGEEAMRKEFERLLPLMHSGGFIPSVDHQTPPHVTLDQYRLFRRLLDEYTAVGGQRDFVPGTRGQR